MKFGVWNMSMKKWTRDSPYMKSGIWDHENYPILEYGKRENMKLGTWTKVILKFELVNLYPPLGSPLNHKVVPVPFTFCTGNDSSKSFCSMLLALVMFLWKLCTCQLGVCSGSSETVMSKWDHFYEIITALAKLGFIMDYTFLCDRLVQCIYRSFLFLFFLGGATALAVRDSSTLRCSRRT